MKISFITYENRYLKDSDKIIFSKKQTHPHNIFLRDPFSAAKTNNQNLNLNLTQTDEPTFFKVNYAKAKDLADLISKNHNLLPQNGSITADPRTNSLLIKGSKSEVKTIHNYLQQVDIPLEQVLIEARIVYADESFARDLGLKFGTSQRHEHSNFGNMNMDLPLKQNAHGHLTLAIAKLKAGVLLDLELTALENEGKGRIVSNPKLVTANRESAYIEAGDEVPYQEKTSSGATNIAFKKAVLGLKVTPEITMHNKINLHLQLNQDKASTININGEPTIQTRKLQTQILVANEETAVLGGIYEEATNHMIVKIPFISAIPILGKLFQENRIEKDRKELLIFVTPKIIRNS